MEYTSKICVFQFFFKLSNQAETFSNEYDECLL